MAIQGSTPNLTGVQATAGSGQATGDTKAATAVVVATERAYHRRLAFVRRPVAGVEALSEGLEFLG